MLAMLMWYMSRLESAALPNIIRVSSLSMMMGVATLAPGLRWLLQLELGVRILGLSVLGL
jgi:hypothetical protein